MQCYGNNALTIHINRLKFESQNLFVLWFESRWPWGLKNFVKFFPQKSSLFVNDGDFGNNFMQSLMLSFYWHARNVITVNEVFYKQENRTSWSMKRGAKSVSWILELNLLLKFFIRGWFILSISMWKILKSEKHKESLSIFLPTIYTFLNDSSWTYLIFLFRSVATQEPLSLIFWQTTFQKLLEIIFITNK